MVIKLRHRAVTAQQARERDLCIPDRFKPMLRSTNAKQHRVSWGDLLEEHHAQQDDDD